MPGTSSPRPLRILVVDDNDAIRENVQECLELEGYEVVVARDGASALARLEAEELPRVVLLDLVMPGMDGREILSRIRGDPRLAAVRVILTTGHTNPRTRAGASPDAFLQKPFGVDELLAAITRAAT